MTHASAPRRLLTLAFAALLLAGVGCRSAAPVRPERPQGSPPAAATPAAGRMVWPRRLQPGDTIAFVAPAGELDRERMALARTRLEAHGYKVVQRDDVFAQEGYLAGSDERRAEELMQAFRDPAVAAIFPGTGGYGTMRILDRLDYAVIRANPKLLIGFSDITGLHAAINRHAGLVTFHSPSPMWGLGSPEGMEPLAEAWFFRAVAGGAAGRWMLDATAASAASAPREGKGEEAGAPPPPMTAWGRGTARGRLVGGNLSLLSALEGTPYAIDTRDAILVIEDVREAPYRIDRMLRQLKLVRQARAAPRRRPRAVHALVRPRGPAARRRPALQHRGRAAPVLRRRGYPGAGVVPDRPRAPKPHAAAWAGWSRSTPTACR